jgi:hypothetical protein
LGAVPVPVRGRASPRSMWRCCVCRARHIRF